MVAYGIISFLQLKEEKKNTDIDREIVKKNI
jgi:hypothetical protein